MRSLISKMWADDQGAVVAPELILIVTLVVIGIIPGLVALRNAENATLADIGNELLAIQTNFSFSGFAITGSGAAALGATIAQVGGLSFSTTNTTYFVSTESNIDNGYATTPVNPAP